MSDRDTYGAPPISTPPAPADGKPSIGQLISQLSEQMTRLVRSEIALVTTELKTKGQRVAVGAGMFGAALVLILYGIGYLFYAAMAGLNEALPLWASALIVSLVLIAIAVVLVLIGRKQLQRGMPPTPTSGVENIKQDVATIKEGLHR